MGQARLTFTCLALGLLLAACEEGAPVALPTPFPTPATPRPAAMQPMATPTPKPSVAPGVTPTPVASGQPPASPTPSPSGSPVPDGYRRTGRALDVALSGPGYFVLATKAQPTGFDDLRLTRDGRFKLDKDTSSSVATWRLKHEPEGLFVVGFQATQGPAEAPEEAASGVFTTSWAGLPATPVGLHLDADRNPKADAEAGWDFRGSLLLKALQPRDVGGQALVAYLALAQVAQPDALATQAGFPGIFRPDPASRPVALGVAVSGAGRPVGNAHLLMPGTLEIIPGLPTPGPSPFFDTPILLSPAPTASGDPVVF